MRYLNGSLCVLLALFTIVQYNDPDAILWIVIYGLPAIWAGFTAYRPNAFEHNHLLVGVFGLNLLAIAAGAIYMWPSAVSTWWDNEEVREGLGLIITTIALLIVAFTLWRTRRGELEQAAAQTADLLVMGAYGHTRLRELVFGGATRHVLREATLPVLFGS